MSQDNQSTTAINTAVIVIGSYHLPASVAVGALVGASLFILSRREYSRLSKAWLFAISYLSGLFGGDDTADFINWFFPDKSPIDINPFTGAAVASAFVVVVIQYGYRYLDRQTGPAQETQS
nr:putative holin [uncultured Kingella sp.]